MADDKKKPEAAPAVPVKPKPTSADVPPAGRPHMVADSEDPKRTTTKKKDE